MRNLLSYWVFQIFRKKSLWGLLSLLAVLALALEVLLVTESSVTPEINSMFPPFPSEETRYCFGLTAKRLSIGSIPCLLGAVVGIMTASHSPEKALPVMAAGHSRKRLFCGEALMGFLVCLGFFLTLEVLECAAFYREFAPLWHWSHLTVTALLGLRLVLALGNSLLFLTLCQRINQVGLILAMALMALEMMGTGSNWMNYLPTGALLPFLMGTASFWRLLLALVEAGIFAMVCFFPFQRKWW